MSEPATSWLTPLCDPLPDVRWRGAEALRQGRREQAAGAAEATERLRDWLTASAEDAACAGSALAFVLGPDDVEGWAETLAEATARPEPDASLAALDALCALVGHAGEARDLFLATLRPALMRALSQPHLADLAAHGAARACRQGLPPGPLAPLMAAHLMGADAATRRVVCVGLLAALNPPDAEALQDPETCQAAAAEALRRWPRARELAELWLTLEIQRDGWSAIEAALKDARAAVAQAARTLGTTLIEQGLAEAKAARDKEALKLWFTRRRLVR